MLNQHTSSQAAVLMHYQLRGFFSKKNIQWFSPLNTEKCILQRPKGAFFLNPDLHSLRFAIGKIKFYVAACLYYIFCSIYTVKKIVEILLFRIR